MEILTQAMCFYQAIPSCWTVGSSIVGRGTICCYMRSGDAGTLEPSGISQATYFYQAISSPITPHSEEGGARLAHFLPLCTNFERDSEVADKIGGWGGVKIVFNRAEMTIYSSVCGPRGDCRVATNRKLAALIFNSNRVPFLKTFI